jgi:hypothetical protein
MRSRAFVLFVFLGLAGPGSTVAGAATDAAAELCV